MVLQLFEIFFLGVEFSSPICFPIFLKIYDLYELIPSIGCIFQQLCMSIVTYMLLCLKYEVKYGMQGFRL